jgi:hypothetical protein
MGPRQGVRINIFRREEIRLIMEYSQTEKMLCLVHMLAERVLDQTPQIVVVCVDDKEIWRVGVQGEGVNYPLTSAEGRTLAAALKNLAVKLKAAVDLRVNEDSLALWRAEHAAKEAGVEFELAERPCTNVGEREMGSVLSTRV